MDEQTKWEKKYWEHKSYFGANHDITNFYHDMKSISD